MFFRGEEAVTWSDIFVLISVIILFFGLIPNNAPWIGVAIWLVLVAGQYRERFEK
jgi:hypothetical protein